MSIDEIKTSFWVSAEIRRCDGLFLPMTVMHKGDAERGLVLIIQYIAGLGSVIYARRRELDGQLIWYNPLGLEPMDQIKTNEYVVRQRQFDEDLWVIEVEDPKRQYSPFT